MDANYIIQTKKQFSNLTKGLKKVGDCLLNNPSIFASQSSKQIGEKIGVSETMVIRFCKSIGYEGFNMLQKDVINSLVLTADNGDESSLEDSNNINLFSEHIKSDVKLLKNNMKILDIEKLETIVETILQSKRIIIAGYYQSFAFAHWLFFNLNYTLGNASLYRPETDALVFDYLPKNSCVIVFSFSRYAIDTIRFAEDAKKKGIKVIVFTDSRVAPIVDYADILILVAVGENSLFEKGPATLSIINSILSEVMKRVDKTIAQTDKFKYFINEE